MTDPLDSNDDWAELARELERDKPPAPPPLPEDANERRDLSEPEFDDAVAPTGETAGEDESEDDDETPAGEAAEGEEQPGTGRKRRRRRRRRRKGGAPGEAVGALAADEEESESEGEAAETDDVPDAEPAAESDDFGPSDSETVEDFDAEPVAAGVEEDTASDVLRDLIATWNVPSWGDIVDGLYRPN